MNKNNPLITNELLIEWCACSEGLKKFNELMPDGEHLEKAMETLIKASHDDYSYWLFSKCQTLKIYKAVIALGYQNSGDQNSGDRNSGHQNSGHRNGGHQNSGNLNSGNLNSGHRNSGNLNSGHLNSGHRNGGHQNSGNQNSGNQNSGNLNSGDLNGGNYNTGYLNTKTPTTINIFDKPCERSEWANAYKPDFLWFSVTKWVREKDMADQEKIDNPNFFTAEGYLKTIPYKEAFKGSWDKADPSDRIKIKDLPNFNAAKFYEISGIDLRN